MVLRRLAVLASALGLTAVSALGSLALPAPAAPEPPVALDPTCAADLVRRAPLGPDAQVLGCEGGDRGRAVIAFGDLKTAEHLAVLVPGSDTDLTTLVTEPGRSPRPHGLPLDWARALAEHAAPHTAVVLWVGYTTPQGLGRAAATGAAARAGAPALASEVRALQQLAPQPPRTTVIGHSYGAVVVALAADDLDVDSLVLLASPGARAGDVEQLHTRARVWALQSPRDWMRRVPGLQVGDLGHGTKPTDPAFGADVVPALDVSGHDGYLVPGTSSFSAVASIMATGDLPGGAPQ